MVFKTWTFIICAVCLPVLCSALELPESKKKILQDYKTIEKQIQLYIRPFTEQLITDDEISPRCIEGLIQTYTGFQQSEEWALRILLSSGSIPTSLLDGGISSFGSHDQCLRARRKGENANSSFVGQYCSLFIHPDKDIHDLARSMKLSQVYDNEVTVTIPPQLRDTPLGMRVGVCTPSSCTEAELDYIVKLFLAQYDISGELVFCKTSEDHERPMTWVQKLCLSYIIITIVLAILGTIIDVKLNRSENHEDGASTSESSANIIHILTFFSIRRNTIRLFTENHKPQTENLQFINGIKVLLSFWIVLGHTYALIQHDMIENYRSVFESMQSFTFQVIVHSFTAVECFFFISGFLLTYLIWTNQESVRRQCQRRGVILVYLTMFTRRYLRIMIPAFSLLACSLLLPLFANSPSEVGGIFDLYTSTCDEKWWKMPLLLGNTDKATEICMVHTWYIAADGQLFIVALFVALMYVWRPKLANIICVLGVLASSAVTMYLTYTRGYSYIINTGDLDFERILVTFEEVYVQAYPHISPYFLGLICGYVSAAFKTVHIPKPVSYALWITSLCLSSWSIFITCVWFNYGFPAKLPGSAYSGFSRTIFSLALFWFMYACSTKRAGFLNTILSHQLFTPLGRLTFGIYLSHLIIIAMKNGLMKTSAVHMNQFIMLKESLGIFSLAVLLAYLFNICIEAPITLIDNFIFQTKPKEIDNSVRKTGKDDLKNHFDPVRQDIDASRSKFDKSTRFSCRQISIDKSTPSHNTQPRSHTTPLQRTSLSSQSLDHVSENGLRNQTKSLGLPQTLQDVVTYDNLSNHIVYSVRC